MALEILKCKFKLLSHTRNLSWGENLYMKGETINVLEYIVGGLPCSSAGKESIYNAEDPASIPGLGRYTAGDPCSIPGLGRYPAEEMG